MTLTQNVASKLVVGFVAVSMLFSLSFQPAQAMTTAEIQAEIAKLMQTVNALQAQLGQTTTTTTTTGGTCPMFTMDLTMGKTGAEVTALQNFLIGKGHAIAAGATGLFGAQTKAALVAFQSANGITPAAGYFGPVTRAKVSAMCAPVTTGGTTTGGTTTGGTTTTTDDSDLTGGAGSVDSYTLISALNNEEVGEDEEDVEVAGLEIEADDGSDLEFTAVRVVFVKGANGNSDFEDYASEVSVMFDGEEVARVDADEFSDDNDWTKTISLDDGAIVKAGETSELTVAVSGVSNLDTNDAGDTWTLDFRQVRFVDADGSSISEDPTTAARSFEFNTFATASDLEMKVSLGDNNPEERVAVIENDGDEVTLLEFEIEADGSDLTINDLPILMATSNAALSDLADEVVLSWDGGEQSENITGASTILFDDLDLEIADGETMAFTVSFTSATSTVNGAQGITVSASVTTDDIDADDQTGEEVIDEDATGSANGETQHIFTIAPEIEVVSVDIDAIDNGTAASEAATAVVKVKLTARGGDIYLNGDDESTENKRFFVGQVYGSGISASTTASSTTYTLSGDYTTTNSGADNEYYTVTEDESVTITVNATVSQGTVTTTAILAGLKAAMIQFGTDSTSDTTRSAIDMNWSDLTDQTQTGTVSLVNPS